MPLVSGSFEIQMERQPPYDTGEGAELGRTSIKKQFEGGLEATSTAEMLTAVSDVPGSAGYVAIERVSGMLEGLSGSFVLLHSGTMTRGAPRLSVSVVPDSGSGELQGISGAMTIDIVEGRHLYTFHYEI